MNGGLSQVDSFDNKPMLTKYHGQPMPGGDLGHERKTGTLMKSPFEFTRYGSNGLEVSELFPNVGACADDILCRSISAHRDSESRAGADHDEYGREHHWASFDGGLVDVRPWHGDKNLPGFVVLCPQVPTTVGPPLWSAGFLPAVNQATYVTSDTRDKNFDPYKLIPDIHNDKYDITQQRKEIDLVKKLDALNEQQTYGSSDAADPQLEATIGSMETAYRMQTEAPDVFDVRKESEATIKMYGEGSTARGCLTAARLIERGVRVVQVYYSMGDPWDAHQDIQSHPQKREGLGPAVCGTDQGPEGARASGRDNHRLWIGIRAYAGRGAGGRRNACRGAITIRMGLRCGLQAAASRAA